MIFVCIPPLDAVLCPEGVQSGSLLHLGASMGEALVCREGCHILFPLPCPAHHPSSRGEVRSVLSHPGGHLQCAADGKKGPQC